jgi:SAM-dependent methyltransferase
MFDRFASEIRAKFTELKEALATIGFRRTCIVIWVRFVDAWFDWRYGLDTVQRIKLEALAISSDNKSRGLNYQPTGIPAFRALLRAVPIPCKAGFVDYGCGKGRVLLLAADAGFQRVVGVEFSPQLCHIARANAARYRAHKPNLPPIEIIETDASRYDPPADTGLFYFYHPFDEIMMRETLDRILKSLRRYPREAILVYNLPRHRQAVEAHPEFVLEREMIAGGYECLVYRYMPEGKGSIKTTKLKRPWTLATYQRAIQ